MKSPKRTWRKRALAGIAVAALAVVTSLIAFSPGSPPAQAGWAGATGGTGCTAVNMARTSTLGMYYWNLSSQMSSAEDWVRSNDVDPTHVNTYGIASQTTDIVVRDLDYASYCGLDWYTGAGSSGTIGLTTCDSLVSGGACLTHSIRYSTNYTNGASTANRRSLACHETGHALGLTHASGSTTCMMPNPNGAPQNYNPTEIGWINAAY